MYDIFGFLLIFNFNLAESEEKRSPEKDKTPTPSSEEEEEEAEDEAKNIFGSDDDDDDDLWQHPVSHYVGYNVSEMLCWTRRDWGDGHYMRMRNRAYSDATTSVAFLKMLN